jgi:putative pyrroloquinoline-quinone binding quinoprotein
VLRASTIVVAAALSGCAGTDAGPGATAPESAGTACVPAYGSETLDEPRDASGARSLRDYPYQPFLQGASIALDVRGERLFALDADSGVLVTIVTDELRVIGRTAVCNGPEQVVVAPGGRAFVSCRRDGTVVALTDGRVSARARVGVEPFAVALTPDAATVLVTVAAERRLVALDAEALETRWSIDLAPEPRGVAVRADGKIAVVAHLVGAAFTVVDLQAQAARRRALPEPTERVAGASWAVAASPGGTRVFVPYSLRAPGKAVVGARGSYGAGTEILVEPRVGVLDDACADADALAPPPPVLPGDGEIEKVGPLFELGAVRAAFHDPRRARLFAVGEASGRMLAFDTLSGVPLASWELEGPASAVAVDPRGERIYVHLALDHQIALLYGQHLGGHHPRVVRRIPIADDTSPPAELIGRRLFHTANDRRIAAAPGVACSTCHLEGRDDGVSWALDDLVLQTPPLRGRLRGHQPLRWRGDSPNLADAVRVAVDRLGGSGLPDVEVDAIVAYLTSSPDMRPSPSPEAPDARGRDLFAALRCTGCHRPERDYTDDRLHDVRGRAFRTPSLRGVSRSAPYYHDGSAPSLAALLAGAEPDDPMAVGNRLDGADREHLARFLQSL